MGSIYKVGKTWTVKLTVGKHFDKNGQITFDRVTKGGFKTKAEAAAYIPSLRAGVSKAPTLKRYYDIYMSSKGSQLSDSKQTAYRIAFQKLEPLWLTQMDVITVGDLQDLINEKAPTYYPARDIKNLLSHLYKLAGVDGNANPALPGLLSLPQMQETAREPFTPEEQAAMWRSYESGCNPGIAIPLIMIYSGMMTGEMRGLTVEMIDWEKKEIRSDVGLKTKERKTKSVLLPDAIMPVLEDIAPESGLFFPISENDFYEYYYDALEKAGVRKLTPYSCRHTTATRAAVDSSVAPQIVQRILRWSSTRMMDRYVHPDDTVAHDALNRAIR